jgi:predicted DNA-binding protein (MmcQ/YjbR family)
MFCVLDEYRGGTAIAVKVGIAAQGIFLEDPRFYRTPYIGKHGWISLRADSTGPAAEIDWEEVEELIKGSYELAARAPKRQPVKRPIP